ncbi:MAG: tail fiber domain-containing protein, partial [Candidatus Omnitrophica bacterium]|nr:tail fiber domain-containing protein [Candidatus Omnitrophota bacterium]
LAGTVGGGVFNTADGTNSTVSGGSGNHSQGTSSTLSGGLLNSSMGENATVGGGFLNVANGLNSTIPGGTGNLTEGIGGFAAGTQAKSKHTGAFVMTDSLPFDFSSITDNELAVRFVGGVRFVTAVDGSGNPTNGVELTAGANSWAPLSFGSDRNIKEKFEDVDTKEILERLTTVRVEKWQYKSSGEATPHIGPMAQDFYAAFEVGDSDKRISPVDANGVALAAIQGLHKMVKEKDQKIESLEKRIEKLEQLIDPTYGAP